VTPVDITSYRDLEVWRKGTDFAADVYRVTKLLPKKEEYRLTSQALVAVNIAEGHMRGSRKEYPQFISTVRGSLAEAETLLMLAVRAELIRNAAVTRTFSLADGLGRQLDVLRRPLISPA
jgi:four helix bundle protein